MPLRHSVPFGTWRGKGDGEEYGYLDAKVVTLETAEWDAAQYSEYSLAHAALPPKWSEYSEYDQFFRQPLIPRQPPRLGLERVYAAGWSCGAARAVFPTTVNTTCSVGTTGQSPSCRLYHEAACGRDGER